MRSFGPLFGSGVAAAPRQRLRPYGTELIVGLRAQSSNVPKIPGILLTGAKHLTEQQQHVLFSYQYLEVFLPLITR